MEEKSIYELILTEIKNNGMISESFHLPETNKTEENKNKIKFVPGALDGVIMYHSSGKENCNIEELKESINLFLSGEIDEAKQRINTYFKNQSALSIIDSFQEWIIDNEKTLDSSKILNLGFNLAVTSNNVEVVKFGLSIIELFNVEQIQKIKDLILNLALCEEFTLFCIFIIRDWENKNEVIFDLAKKLNGWGKIHAVENLDAVNDEIKEWIVCYGCQNDILPQYLSLTCLGKGDVLNLLKNGNITDYEFQGISVIVAALCMVDGPYGDCMKGYHYNNEFMYLYAVNAEKFVNNINNLVNIINLESYLNKNKNTYKDSDKILKICENIILNQNWNDKIIYDLNHGHENEALQAAQRLNYDLRKEAFEVLLKNPIDLCFTTWYFFEYDNDEEYIKKIVDLYKNALPFDKMALGIDDIMATGNEYKNYSCLNYLLQFLCDYPSVGEDLINLALNCPMVSCRTIAMNVLESWIKTDNYNTSDFSAKISKSILDNIPLEVNSKLKERYLKLNINSN